MRLAMGLPVSEGVAVISSLVELTGALCLVGQYLLACVLSHMKRPSCHGV